MATLKFSVDKVRAAIESSKRQTGGASEDFTPVAFLPPGIHHIRFFFDPTGEVLRTYVAHKNGKDKTLCPTPLKGEGIPEECTMCKIQVGLDQWQLAARREVLVYGQVIKTNRANEYWDVNKAYCIVGRPRLQTALTSMLGLIDENQEYILNMLNPGVKSTYCKVEVIPGAQGSVSIQPVPNSSEPILNLDDPPGWWKPLTDIWIPNKFSMVAYEQSLRTLVKEKYAEIIEVPSLKTDPVIAKVMFSILQEKKDGGESGQAKEPAAVPSSSPASAPAPTVSQEEVPASEPVQEKKVPTCFGKYSPDKRECIACQDDPVECMIKTME